LKTHKLVLHFSL